MQTMNLSYFEETDTLYIEFNVSNILEANQLDENTVLDKDKNGDVVSITFEYLSERTNVDNTAILGIAA